MPNNSIYWCHHCNVPVFQERCPACCSTTRRIGSDLRPVFPEEKMLLEILLGFEDGSLDAKSVWEGSGSRLIIDGKATPLRKGELLKKDPSTVRELLKEKRVLDASTCFFKRNIGKFCNINKDELQHIELQAFDIIKDSQERYPDAMPVVSFSGGKDSAVTSHLVRRHYATQSIIHVLGDTTLEFPSTYDYIERFKEEHSYNIPFFIDRSGQDFLKLCKSIGPPSRVMRWCCTVFKTGIINRILTSLGGNGQVLTYYGIRHSESTRRSNYEAITKSPKVAQQIVVSPIIEWLDIHVWLYTLSHNLIINEAYRHGFSRVGCYCCPSNSSWSWFLLRIYEPELAEQWRKFLIQFAISIGKPDPEVYVDSGKWKARQGGSGMDAAKEVAASSRPCGDERARVYQLSKAISDRLYEYFKPFGKLDFTRGRSVLGEVFVLDKRSGTPVLLLQGKHGSSELRVTVYSNKNLVLLFNRVDCQIRKYQSCICCGGCSSICPQGAIIDFPRYTIDDDKCINCLKCIAHFDTGCLVSKVLKVRKDE